MNKRQKNSTEKASQDAYDNARALMADNIRNNDTGFDTWEYLKNNNPFQAFPMNNIEGNMEDAPFFSDFSQDIFKNEASVIPVATKASSVPKPVTAMKTRSSTKPYDRKEYLEDNYRLKNQLIFSNSATMPTRISTPASDSQQTALTSHSPKSSYVSSNGSSKGMSHSVSMPVLNSSSSLELNPAVLNSWISSNAKDKRRERNKVFARKTRLKRKQELEDLRDRVCNLKIENDALKSILNQKLPMNVSNDVVTSCHAQIPENVDSIVNQIVSRMRNTETQLIASLHRQQRAFCISSAVAPDCPIVYASPGFAELTGYDVHSVLGRNCRFLQGPDTNPEHVKQLRVAIKANHEVQCVLRNYRKNGSPFWNFIQISPLKDLQGMMTLIIGVQVEIDNPPPEVRQPRIIHPTHTLFHKQMNGGEIEYILATAPIADASSEASTSISLPSSESDTLLAYQNLSDIDFKKLDRDSHVSGLTTNSSVTGSMNYYSETSSVTE